jgi:ribosome-associated toxin RatA of RatAB toxin-antitoxin module
VTIIALVPLYISTSSQVSKAEEPIPVLPYDSTMVINRLIEVSLSKMPDGVTGIKSFVYINATPVTVWKVLTDYNNLKRYIPRMVKSDLVADKGKLKVIALTGEFKVLIFKKTVQLTINMHEAFPLRIDYEQISGDFDVYRGSWTLQKHAFEGTLLTYESEIKPSFVVPDFIFQGILKNDIVGGLTALRGEAERTQAK